MHVHKSEYFFITLSACFDRIRKNNQLLSKIKLILYFLFVEYFLNSHNFNIFCHFEYFRDQQNFVFTGIGMHPNAMLESSKSKLSLFFPGARCGQC